jgi:propanediol dehydratase small subunit
MGELPMSPEDRAMQLAEIARYRKTAGRALRVANELEAAYWAEIRATVPKCATGKHDIENFLGNTFMVYRCRVCGDEEWL